MANNPVPTREHLIQSIHDNISRLRSPLANLQAAAENLTSQPDISPVMRSAFENIILQESSLLTTSFAEIIKISRSALNTIHNHHPLNARTFVEILQDNYPKLHIDFQLDPTLELQVNKHDVLLLLNHLLNKLKNQNQILCRINLHEHLVILSLVWQGPAPTPADADRWQSEILQDDPKQRDLNTILLEHDSDLWCGEKEGKNFLNFSLPHQHNPTGK